MNTVFRLTFDMIALIVQNERKSYLDKVVTFSVSVTVNVRFDVTHYQCHLSLTSNSIFKTFFRWKCKKLFLSI